jgi:hypothetical protein
LAPDQAYRSGVLFWLAKTNTFAIKITETLAQNLAIAQESPVTVVRDGVVTGDGVA